MLLKSLRLLVAATPLLLCLGWAAPALAGQVRLAWDPTTTHIDGSPATDLAGYHLYYWQGSPSTRQRVDVGNTTTYTLTGLVEGGTYALAVTAYNTAGNESADSNTLTVTIASVNHAPLALADTSAATAGTPLTIAVLANDTDADGNPLTITAVSQGAHGTITISGSKVIYTPVAAFVGTDSFTYTITDGQGASATATVTVNVLAGNRPPSALADTITMPAGTSVTIAVLANDTDPDSHPLTITAVTQGAHGTVTRQSNSVTYTPVAAFVGTDSFTYTVTDGQGASATATVMVTVLPDRAASLVAAYHFNEGSGPTVTDASGHAHTGTLSGATWTIAGKFGSALVFNGTNARVTIPDAPALRLTTAMTIEAWVKPSVVTNAWRKVLSKGKQDYRLDAMTDRSKVPAGGGTFGPAQTKTITYGTAALAANTWAHLALTYDGATLRLYVNGVQVASQARTGSLVTSASALLIGADSVFGHYFQGTLDEVRIYNVALLPSEIQADMQTPVGRLPVAAYGFHETSGTIVTDASGNNNAGTLGSGITRSTQGKFGSALVFNGSSFVTIPAATSLDLTTAMTLEAWVYPTATPTDWSTVLMKERPGELVYGLWAGSPTNHPNVNFNTATSFSGEHGLDGPTALPLNTWSHLAATYDRATLRLYVNGVQVASRASTGTIVTSTGALRIGGNSVWGEYFKGRIDEVRIYNQVLSASEIQADMVTPVK